MICQANDFEVECLGTYVQSQCTDNGEGDHFYAERPCHVQAESIYLNVKMHNNDELLHKMNALIIMTDDDSHLLRNP